MSRTCPTCGRTCPPESHRCGSETDYEEGCGKDLIDTGREVSARGE